MRSIFCGVILLLASTAIVEPAHAEKNGYAQAHHPSPTNTSKPGQPKWR
jgi:hypothetical protein